MNNWDQFQSTPKLLPPTVFEQFSANNSNIDNTNNNNHNHNNSNNNNNCIDRTAAGNESFSTHGDSQFYALSNELEKMKYEIKKLHTENEALRHKNRGEARSPIMFF